MVENDLRDLRIDISGEREAGKKKRDRIEIAVWAALAAAIANLISSHVH